MSVVPVVESIINVPYSIDKFIMILGDLKLNESIGIGVECYYQDRKVYYTSFLIQGEEYTAWGNDDDYLKNLIASKLGLIPLAIIKEENVEAIVKEENIQLIIEDFPIYDPLVQY